MNTDPITIEATVNAPVEIVWTRWTEPEHITQWNQASDDWHCPSAENDLRTGGKYRARMEAKDGSIGFDFEVIYDEVIPHRKIAYTMPDGRRAITLFEEEKEQTRITTVFDPETINSREMQQDGWQAILANFKSYVEKS